MRRISKRELCRSWQNDYKARRRRGERLRCDYCGLSYDYAVCPFDGTRLEQPSASTCQNPQGTIHNLVDIPKEYLRYQEYLKLSTYNNLAACPNCRTPYFYTSFPSNLKNEFDKKRKSEECFIATAAMGSHLHPHVQALRSFRDGILLKSKHRGSFESLLAFYYQFSPPIARAMSHNMPLKIFLKYALIYPIVFGIKGVLPLFDAVLGISKDAKHSSKS